MICDKCGGTGHIPINGGYRTRKCPKCKGNGIIPGGIRKNEEKAH